MDAEATQIEMEREPERNKGGRPPGSKDSRPRKTRFSAYKPTGEGTSEAPDASKTGDLRIKLDTSGNVDIARHNAESIEKIKAFITNPSVRESLGLTQEQLTQLILTDEDVQTFYNVLASVETFIATRFRHVPQDIATKHLKFKDDEVKALMEPTKVMVAKYVPASLLSRKDEAAFLLMFIMIHREKWGEMTTEARKRAEFEQASRRVESGTKEPEVIV